MAVQVSPDEVAVEDVVGQGLVVQPTVRALDLGPLGLPEMSAVKPQTGRMGAKGM